MSDATKPQPITFNDGTTTAYTPPTPMPQEPLPLCPQDNLNPLHP